MKHTYRLGPTQYERYTFSALANAELENLIHIIREEGYQSPEHMDVLHQAEVKLRERMKGSTLMDKRYYTIDGPEDKYRRRPFTI